MTRSAPLAATIFAATVLGALDGAARATTGPWFETPEGKVRLVSARAIAAPDGDPALGVEFALAPGWHVYWRNAGDAGYPPEVRPIEGSALAAATLLYPAPERFDLPGDLVAFGYEHEVIYPLDARLGADPGAAPARLGLRIDYLVCAASCIPYAADLALELPLGAAADDPEIAPRLAGWRARLPLDADAAEGLAVSTKLDDGAEGAALELTFAGAGVTAVAPDLFFDVHPELEIGRPVFVATAAGPRFRVPVKPLDACRPLPARFELAWTATGFEAAGRAVAWQGRAVVDRATAAAAPAAAASAAPRVALAAAAVAAVLVVLFALARARRARPSRT